MGSEYETVHTTTDWYDGPREGVADFGGVPHAYRCVFDDAANDWSDIFLLGLVDNDTFRLAMEDWQMWRRWEAAHRAGRANLTSHAVLPEDRRRHEQIKPILEARLAVSPVGATQARADFQVKEGETVVRWTVVKQADPDEWLFLLYSIGAESGVVLSDEALSRESLYEDHD